MENKTNKVNGSMVQGINGFVQYQAEKKEALAQQHKETITIETKAQALLSIMAAQEGKYGHTNKNKKELTRLQRIETLITEHQLTRPQAEAIVDELFPAVEHTNIDGENLNKIDLDKLVHMPFNSAHKYIVEQSTPEERLAWGDEASQILSQLYELTKLYGNNRSPKDMENGIIHMTPEEFQRLLNKIKHYETVIGWFYETDMTWLDEDTLNLELGDI